MQRIDFYDLVNALSHTTNLTSIGAGIDWGCMKHSSRVCYIACRIAEKVDLEEELRFSLYCAALLHELGLSSTREFRDVINLNGRGDFGHCKRGYEILNKSLYTKRFSDIILHHHDKWTGSNVSGVSGNDIPVCSRIIHLADYVDMLMRPREYILHQRDSIVSNVNELSGIYFDPDVVDAFNQLATLESLWLDLTSRYTEELLHNYAPEEVIALGYNELEDVAGIFTQIVDAKSPFTMRHSRRVASVASELARRLKFTRPECQEVYIAGLLHDLGTLSIPDDIFNKEGKLTEDEYEIVKRRAYFTRTILNRVRGLEVMAEWVSLYYTEEEALPAKTQILVVSDVFTALAENRPYRRGYPVEQIVDILNDCVSEGALDGGMVDIITKDIERFYELLEVDSKEKILTGETKL